MEAIKVFFSMKNESSISKILNASLENVPPFEYQYLDDLWIEGYIKQHLELQITNYRKYENEKQEEEH